MRSLQSAAAAFDRALVSPITPTDFARFRNEVGIGRSEMRPGQRAINDLARELSPGPSLTPAGRDVLLVAARLDLAPVSPFAQADLRAIADGADRARLSASDLDAVVRDTRIARDAALDGIALLSRNGV